MDPNPLLWMNLNNSTAGHDESKRNCQINSFLYPDLHFGFSRLPPAFLSLREEDAGDSQRALGEFHVLERNQGLFPVHVSLSTLQASGLFFWFVFSLSDDENADWVHQQRNHHIILPQTVSQRRLLEDQSGRVEGLWGEAIWTLNCLCSMKHMTAALLGETPASVCSIRVGLHSVK